MVTNQSIPIFILGAPRSGTTWLGKTFEQHPDIKCWYENNAVWTWGNSSNSNDVLTEINLNPKINNYIQKRFIEYFEKSGKKYIIDKTPRNCLRIPFIYGIFPEAKIIMLLRDGRSVISSTNNKLKQKRKVPWKDIKTRLESISIWELHTFIPRLASRCKSMMGIKLDYWGG